MVRDLLLDTNTTMLGLSGRHHPDWFTGAEDVLRLLINKRNKLFSLVVVSTVINRNIYHRGVKCRSVSTDGTRRRLNLFKLHFLKANLV